MFGIVKKDMVYFLGYLLLLPLMLLYWYVSRDRLDTTTVFMVSGWLYVVVLGSIIAAEMNEMKSRGYVFLASLPVSPREIVAGKFILILVQAASYTVVAYFAFAGLGTSPDWLDLARKWLLANTAFALCLSGFVYWFVFRFGFERAVYLQAALFMLALLVPIALNEIVIRGYLDDSSALFRLAGSTGNGSLLIAGAAVYLACYYISVLAYEREVPAS